MNPIPFSIFCVKSSIYTSMKTSYEAAFPAIPVVYGDTLALCEAAGTPAFFYNNVLVIKSDEPSNWGSETGAASALRENCARILGWE